MRCLKYHQDDFGVLIETFENKANVVDLTERITLDNDNSNFNQKNNQLN